MKMLKLQKDFQLLKVFLQNKDRDKMILKIKIFFRKRQMIIIYNKDLDLMKTDKLYNIQYQGKQNGLIN